MSLLPTGLMIQQLRVSDEAECNYEEGSESDHLIVRRSQNGSIIIVRNGSHTECLRKPLMLTSKVMSYSWRIIPHYVSFEEAMRAHREDHKTITYHHDESTSYTFERQLTTDQFKQLANDSLCMYELAEGKWTIDN